MKNLKKQIADIKRTLESEKRKLGDYDDSRGLRYYPPKAYIKLSEKFIDIHKRVKSEPDVETRRYLLQRVRQLEDEA